MGWGTPEVSEGRWRLGLFCSYRRYPNGVRGPDPLHPLTKKAGIGCIRISLRGVVLWSVALAVVAYFAGAAVLVRWYQAMPHNQIGYADLVMPTRWSHVSSLRGQALIADAYEDLAGTQFRSGFAKLRAGVARNPEDAKARLDLARIYVSLRLRPAAERLLFDAFAHRYPGGTFVRDAAALIAEGDNAEQSVAFCEAARSAGERAGVSAEDLRVLEAMRVRALTAAGRLDEAVALARRALQEDDTLVRDVVVRHLLKANAYDEAVREVEAWRAQAGSPPEALRLAVQVYREAGRFVEMREALARLRVRLGASAEFAAYEVVQHALAAQPGVAEEAVDDFLFRYGANPRHLRLLATLLAEPGETDLILRVETDARERGVDVAGLRLARLRALIERGDWAGANALASVIAGGGGRLSEGERTLFQTLSLLARACSDGESGAKAGVVDAIAKRPGTLTLYRTVIEGLMSAGQPQTALAVLSFGEGRFPDSDYLAEARSRVTVKVVEAEIAAGRAAASRKEEASLLADLPALLKAVAAEEATGRRDEALTLIRRHRRAAPAVFTDGNAELARREVRLSAEGGDLSALRYYLRTHLKAGALTGAEALALAKAWHEAGRVEAARLTVRELINRNPKNAAALAVWADWMPAPDPVEAGQATGEAVGGR